MNGPWRIPLMAMVVVALSIAGCGGGGGAGGNGDGGQSDLPTSAVATSEDAEETTYPLAAGRYRLSYRAPGCQQVVVSINSVDGSFTYEQQPRGFTSFINDMPDGEYNVTVTSDCEEWTLNLNQF